jgi:hypothetical protein
MIDPIELASEFFEELTTIDTRIVEHAAREPCRDCGGPLYRGDYPRKPRGGFLSIAAEALRGIVELAEERTKVARPEAFRQRDNGAVRSRTPPVDALQSRSIRSAGRSASPAVVRQ